MGSAENFSQEAGHQLQEAKEGIVEFGAMGTTIV